MEIIYIDSLFFINLLADYLLLLCAGRICSLSLKRGRYFLSALTGAAYSAAVFLPGLYFLSSAPAKLLCGVIMALIAYGGELRPLRCAGVFLALSAAFGGALWAMGLSGGPGGGVERLSFKFIMSAFTLCYFLGSIVLRFRAAVPGRKKSQVRLIFDRRECRFTALCDTGNSLTDPVSGQAVMIVSPHALKPAFPAEEELFRALSPVELMELSASLPSLRGRLRLIPYSALGKRGLLPVIRPDSVFVDGREAGELITAISPDASGDGYEGIL